MRIGNVDIGSGHPCRIVAELSNAHNGSLDRMLRLMRTAKDAGADLLKAQAFTPDELVALRGEGPAPEPWGSQGWTMRALYEKAQTPLTWFPELFDQARRLEIPLFASVFGPTSLETLEKLGCPAWKVSHFECANDELAKLVMATKKPIVVSQSGPLARVSTHYWKANVVRMLCPGGYPAAPDELRLGLKFLWEPWGLSSHCKDPMVGPVAVARGASMLEYHFMLDNEPSELERNVSLTDWEFAAMVDDVRAAEVVLG